MDLTLSNDDFLCLTALAVLSAGSLQASMHMSRVQSLSIIRQALETMLWEPCLQRFQNLARVQGGSNSLDGIFTCNAQQPLEAPRGRLSILVDETSMLDMSLASSLLDAIPTNIPVQLVLVGEPLHPIIASPSRRA